MLHTSPSNNTTAHDPHAPLRVPPERVELAKFPPDDDALPPGPPGGGMPAGGSFDMGDGNFKRGRFAPVAILIGLLAVAGFVVFLLIGTKQESEKLTIEQAEEQKKAIYVLPKEEAAGKWREWAQSDRSDYLKEEALKQLAWLKDPAGVDLAIKSLSYPAEPIQGMAATALAEYGSPLADKAKDPLLAALKTAPAGAKPQIAWALVVLGESRAFEDIMTLYRLGHLSKVQRLGGGVAFDPERIVKLVSLDKLASSRATRAARCASSWPPCCRATPIREWTAGSDQAGQGQGPGNCATGRAGPRQDRRLGRARAAARGAEERRQGKPQEVSRSAARRHRRRRSGAGARQRRTTTTAVSAGTRRSRSST